MAASTVAGTASTASASPVVQISFDGLCIHIGPKASKSPVRAQAATYGYFNVTTFRVIPKRYLGHYGVYLSGGRTFGRKYWLVSSLKTDNLLRVRPMFGGAGPVYKVPPHVIRNKMAMMGYKNLHMPKYNNFSRVYNTVRGWKRYGNFWRKYIMRFARHGVFLSRTYLRKVPGVSGAYLGRTLI